MQKLKRENIYRRSILDTQLLHTFFSLTMKREASLTGCAIFVQQFLLFSFSFFLIQINLEHVDFKHAFSNGPFCFRSTTFEEEPLVISFNDNLHSNQKIHVIGESMNI